MNELLLNEKLTCPFNNHNPCQKSCMFVIRNDGWILGCKLEQRDNNVSLDPEYALVNIAESLDKIVQKISS